MKKPGRSVVAGMALSLLAPLGQANAAESISTGAGPELSFAREQGEAMLEARRRAVSKWAGLSAVKFVMLENAEEFTCHPEAGRWGFPVKATSYSVQGPFFCRSANAVVINAGWMNAFGKAVTDGQPQSIEAFGSFVVSHEYGHALQQSKGVLGKFTTGGDRVLHIRRQELQADCLAGQVMESTVMVDEVQSILDQFPSEVVDPGHGGSEARRESFTAGASGSFCQ